MGTFPWAHSKSVRPHIPILPSGAKSEPGSQAVSLRAEGCGGLAWSPHLPCLYPSQGSSDFCVDPDTYVTRMVEEHSVLSGGESEAGTPAARLGRPN